MSDSDLTRLFAEYEIRNDKVNAAKKALEDATAERSEVVKAISMAVKPSKRVMYKDRILTIVQRKNTFFFRGFEADDDIVKVE